MLSALFALAAHATLPKGGHDYLLGLASLLGTKIGVLACATFLLALCVHLARGAIAKRRAGGDEP